MADSLAKPCKYQHLHCVTSPPSHHISSEALNSIIPEAVLPGHRGGRGRATFLTNLVWGYKLYQKISYRILQGNRCKAWFSWELPHKALSGSRHSWSIKWISGWHMIMARAKFVFVLKVYLETWKVPVHVPRNQMCSRPDQISETGNNQTLMSTASLVTL